MRTALAIPMLDSVPAEVVPSLLTAAAEAARLGEVLVTCPINMKPHDRARNYVMQNVLNYECDFLFFIDSDTVPPPGSLGLLMETMQETCAAVVSGYYLQRGYPFLSTWATVADDGVLNYRQLDNTEVSGPVEIGGCGMGCALIDLRFVRENLNGPEWFLLTKADGRRVWEDVYFCMSVTAAGGHIYGDPRVVCGHLHDRITITPDNADALRRQYIIQKGSEVGND